MDDEYRSWPLRNIEAPLANDVVYGRGGLANNHKGNKRFRDMVAEFKDDYAKCSRHQKTLMAEEIAKKWRDQSPPGRFIKMDAATGLWYDVGVKLHRAKVSQTLREGPLKKTPADNSTSTSTSVPPPPPPPLPSTSSSSVEDEVICCETPPQTRPTKQQYMAESPTSVMGMPFCPVEDEIAEEAGRKLRQHRHSSNRIASFFEGIGLPGFHRRQKSKRINDSSDEDDDDTVCQQPPAKRPAFQNPLASFLGSLVQDKLPQVGPKTITIVQDTAVPVVLEQAPAVQPTEVIHLPEVVQQTAAVPRAIRTSPVPCTNNCAAVPAREYPVPPPRRSVTAAARKSISNTTCGDPSLTWRNVELDFDNTDPILSKYIHDGFEDSNPRPRGITNATDAQSMSSGRSFASLDTGTLLEDLQSLPGLFRDRCDTGSSAMDIFQQAYPDARPHQLMMPPIVSIPIPTPPPALQGMVPQPQPDPMDFDMLSLESFSDHEEDNEDPWDDYDEDEEQQDNCNQTAFEFDTTPVSLHFENSILMSS